MVQIVRELLCMYSWKVYVGGSTQDSSYIKYCTYINQTGRRCACLLGNGSQTKWNF